jgi:hypothetical protein
MVSYVAHWRLGHATETRRHRHAAIAPVLRFHMQSPSSIHSDMNAMVKLGHFESAARSTFQGLGYHLWRRWSLIVASLRQSDCSELDALGCRRRLRRCRCNLRPLMRPDYEPFRSMYGDVLTSGEEEIEPPWSLPLNLRTRICTQMALAAYPTYHLAARFHRLRWWSPVTDGVRR